MLTTTMTCWKVIIRRVFHKSNSSHLNSAVAVYCDKCATGYINKSFGKNSLVYFFFVEFTNSCKSSLMNISEIYSDLQSTNRAEL